MPKDNVAELVQQAQAEMNKGNHQPARAMFLRVLESRPDSPDAHYGLATVCFLMGDMLGAAHHFKEVTRHDPLRAGAFINLGALYNHLGREDDAIAALSRGIQLDPQRAEGYYNLGLVYRRIGQPSQAIEAYREAVRTQPGLADAHLNLANILLDEDAIEDAIIHYEAALKLRPDWPEAAQGLAMAREALESEPEDIEAPSGPAIEVPAEKPSQLDPARHGALLADIHKTTAKADELAKTLGADVVRHFEAALKDLSACLLRSDVPEHELAESLDAFERVADRFRNLRGEWDQVHRHILASTDGVKRK